jgi:hypothetical protein
LENNRRKPVHTIFRNGMLLAVLLLSVSACSQGNDGTPAGSDSAVAEPAPAAQGGMPRTSSVAGASVFFVTPRDGSTVSNPVILNFAVTGMSVAPAGDSTPMSGHHHVLIDAELPAMDMPIPADANHVHFGDGSSTTELTLEPGEHTLQLLFADHLHIPHDPPVYSDRITITVE